MLKIFARVDNILIDRVFQDLVNWLTPRLLLDCFGQARFCTNVSAFAWIWSQARAVWSASIGIQVFQAALLLLGLGALMALHTLFHRIGGTGSEAKVNPLRAGMYAHRFIILSGLVVNIAKATVGLDSCALLAVAAFTTAAVYLGACSNPPPKPRERWDSGGRLAALAR